LQFAVAGVVAWRIDFTTKALLGNTDNTYDIGASGATRPRYIYVGTGVITPVVATPLVQSSTALQFYANNVAKWRIHTTGDLWAETDNAFDIGAVGAVRPRDLFLGRNLTVGGTTTFPDLGADTPSLKNQGMTAFGGRINIGGLGGADRIGFMVTGINTPSTTLMNGSTQTLWYAEYWSNDANTGSLNGLDFGVIGPPSVKVSEINIARLRGVGARTQKPDFARGLKVESIDNGAVDNIGVDIAVPGNTASTRKLSLRAQGNVELQGNTYIGNALDGWINRDGPSGEIRYYAQSQLRLALGYGSNYISVPGQIRIGPDATGKQPTLRAMPNHAHGLSMEAPGLYAIMAGGSGSMVTYNAIYDGSAWQRQSVAADASYLYVGQGFAWATAPAGANPISGWTNKLYIDNAGNTTVTGNIDLVGTLTAQGNVIMGSAMRTRAGIIYIGAEAGPDFTISVAGPAGGAWCVISAPGALQINTNALGFYGDAWIRRSTSASIYLEAGHVFGVGGVNVGANGVLASFHGNVYGGVFYSTTGAFAAWPSEGRFKAAQAALPDPLRLLDRAAISYRQPHVEWADGEALVQQDEDGAPAWGFRADDWRDHPELVQPGPAGIDSFNLIGMIPLTWEAVRALYAELTTLKLRVEELENA
jgi:hypothetical protein